jgi:hypothetical protein
MPYAVRLGRITIRGGDRFDPDTPVLEFQQNIWARLMTRHCIAQPRTMFQQGAREVHFPEPGVKVAPDLAEEMFISIRVIALPQFLREDSADTGWGRRRVTGQIAVRCVWCISQRK